MSWMTPMRRVKTAVATPAPAPTAVPRRGPAKPLPVTAAPATVTPAAAAPAAAAPAPARKGFGGIIAQAARRVALKGKPRLTNRWRVGY